MPHERLKKGSREWLNAVYLHAQQVADQTTTPGTSEWTRARDAFLAKEGIVFTETLRPELAAPGAPTPTFIDLTAEQFQAAMRLAMNGDDAALKTLRFDPTQNTWTPMSQIVLSTWASIAPTKLITAFQEKELAQWERDFQAGRTDAAQNVAQARAALQFSYTQLDQQKQFAFANLGFAREELALRAQLGFGDLNLRRQLAQQQDILARAELDLRGELGRGELGLARQQFEFQREQTPIERLFQQQMQREQLGQRQRESELGALTNIFQGALQEPFAFAALQTLGDVGRQPLLEQAEEERFGQAQQAEEQRFGLAQEQFGREQQAFQQQMQQRGVAEQIMEALRFMAQNPSTQGGPLQLQTAFAQNAPALALLSQPAPIAPTAPTRQAVGRQPVPQRRPSQFESELQAGLGFNIPGVQAPLQGFFPQGVPTVGGLGQVTPEALQFLQAILGFRNISPGRFARASQGVTPMPAGAARLPRFA